MNYYNDNDKFIVKWLKELIKAGLIPPGHVDGRSIHEVTPDDIKGYTQKHFFAGIAGWPQALKLAGWNPTKPVWTASLPCQPFSVAGQQRGEKDERHLWPTFFNLVKECRPPVILGEQVASKDGREWLAGIQIDLETLGYRCAAADLPAASVGAPHKRNRLFWVAVTSGQGLPKRTGNGGVQSKTVEPSEGKAAIGTDKTNSTGGGFWHNSTAIPCADGKFRRVPTKRMANPERIGLQKPGKIEGCSLEASGGNGELADSDGRDTKAEGIQRGREYGQQQENGGIFERREIEPALFPLADGIPNRVGALRGAGNAIVPQVAAVFISAIMDILNEN